MFINEKISKNLLILAFVLVGVGFLGIATWHLWFGIFGFIGCFMLSRGFKLIPADPPSVGLLTVRGKRQPVLIQEGLTFVAAYFPILIDVIIIKVERKESDYVYTDIRCKNVDVPDVPASAGGAVTVKVSITHEPDYRAPEGGKRLIQYMNSRQEKGADHILQDVIGKFTRNIASEYTWEEFIFLKAPLEASLLMQVADTQFKLLPRESDGSISEATFNKFGNDPKEYDRITKQRIDTLEYVKEVDTLPGKDDHQKFAEKKLRLREIETFLKIALVNGGGDVMDMGVRISRLNVVHIKPEGELGKDADLAAVAKKIKEALLISTTTDVELAEIYLQFGIKHEQIVKVNDALQWVRTNRGKDTEVIIKGGGGLAGAAAVFGAASKGGK